MNTTYDRDADAAYFKFVDTAPGEAVEQQIVPLDDKEAEIVLDFDRNGFLLGLEVLGAAAVLRKELLATATDITGTVGGKS